MKIMHLTETMASGVLKYLQEVVRDTGHNTIRHYIVYSRRRYTPNDLHDLFPDSVCLLHVDINIKHGSLASIRKIYKSIQDIEPDIIHLHSSIAGFLGRFLLLMFPKKRIYYTPHGYSFLMSHKSKLTRLIFWITEFMLSQIRGNIIACSKSEYRYARKLSPFRKVYLLENCTKLLVNHDNSKPSFQNRIIGIGRMEEQKDPILFIEIIARLKQIVPTIRAIWIGDGLLKAECEELNRNLKADVFITGWLSNKETLGYLEQSTVFLQTSKWEGLPYTLLEAFALGVPVVASDITSHRDLIGDQYMGFLAKEKEEYVNHILSLLNNVELSRTIAETNKKQVEHNYTIFSQTLGSIYRAEF